MILEATRKNPGARFLFIFACLVISVAGLRAAAPILVPFALALFLSIVSMPLMFFLQTRARIRAPFAILITVGLSVGIFATLIGLAVNSLGALSTELTTYQSAFIDRWEAMSRRWEGITAFLEGFGLRTDLLNESLGNLDLVDTAWGFTRGAVVGGLGAVASAVSMTFLVALISVFILAETTVFPFKFQAILGARRTGRMDLAKTVREIQAFLGIKLLVSLATGVVAGLFCWFMGLDVPLLLGMIAFVLNFVPTIGSIIAAVPALVLAFILQDIDGVVLVAIGYFAINTLFGNIIEPHLMGRRLGLSTLVIVLSLMFWFWVWGPIGALLSVPLTMVLKIILENTPDLRWVAVLLDKVPPQARAAAAAAAAGAAAGGATAPVAAPPTPAGPVQATDSGTDATPSGTASSVSRDTRDGVASPASDDSVTGQQAKQTTG